jgi:DNA-binding GntR family transcriptional regulator
VEAALPKDIPLFRQIADTLRADVQSGKLTPASSATVAVNR